MLDQIEQAAGTVHLSVDIVASIESARGLWDIGSIAGWKSQLPNSRLRMDALLFAAEDCESKLKFGYRHAFSTSTEAKTLSGTDCADTRVQRSSSGEELLYPRSHIVVAARAFGLHSIDMVSLQFLTVGYVGPHTKFHVPTTCRSALITRTKRGYKASVSQGGGLDSAASRPFIHHRCRPSSRYLGHLAKVSSSF